MLWPYLRCFSISLLMMKNWPHLLQLMLSILRFEEGAASRQDNSVSFKCPYILTGQSDYRGKLHFNSFSSSVLYSRLWPKSTGDFYVVGSSVSLTKVSNFVWTSSTMTSTLFVFFHSLNPINSFRWSGLLCSVHAMQYNANQIDYLFCYHRWPTK